LGPGQNLGIAIRICGKLRCDGELSHGKQGLMGKDDNRKDQPKNRPDYSKRSPRGG
jgi:hypothetical protein